MEVDLMQLAATLEAKPNLMKALAQVKSINKVFLKNSSRERGINYIGSETLLAAMQKPLLDAGIHVQQFASDYKQTNSQYDLVSTGKGQKSVKEAKVTCLFSATHLESGETLIFPHSTVATADGMTSMHDAVAKAKTACIGSFIRGLVLSPKLTQEEVRKTASTIDAQNRLNGINKDIKQKIEQKAG